MSTAEERVCKGRHGSNMGEHRLGIVERLMIIDQLLCWSSYLLQIRPDLRKSNSVDGGRDLIASHHSGFIFRKKRFVVPQTAPNC